MEVPSQEGEMPIPLNSSYGHGHMIHNHDHHAASHNHIGGPRIASSAAIEDDPRKKKMVRFKECLKNHAAAMGGNATDGCGEFMASGEEGTLEALTCSACNCHRNFHRKEVHGQPSRKLFVGPDHPALAYHHHHGAGGALRAVPPHPMIMPYNIGGGASDKSDCGPPHQVAKKRFRTKFTAEQKEKLLSFAEKVGWKIQKQEEGVVQQFCQEVGVKRRVLKVWMHNNKHNLANKNLHSHPQTQL